MCLLFKRESAAGIPPPSPSWQVSLQQIPTLWTVIAEESTVTSKVGYNGKGIMKFLGNESNKIKKNDNINQIQDHIKQNFPNVVVLACTGLHKCDNITQLITLSMITINGAHCTLFPASWLAKPVNGKLSNNTTPLHISLLCNIFTVP